MPQEWPLLGKERDADAIKRVLSGASGIASAAWWGFDAEDSTQFFQSAIDSGAKTVLVPYMGKPWVVRPIHLRSNQTLLFEPGVVVLAKRGEFKGKGDSLFSAADKKNIVLRGYGARFIMHKEDYQSEAYEKAEWRMGVNLSGCSRVRIEGMRIEKTGGDGIYLGAGRKPYCKDIVIRDVQCVDNHRQGISVIGAENLLIENCTLSGTRGAPPQAGIDFEPNEAANRLVNCVMRDCVIEENIGREILVFLGPLSSKTVPLSIRVENCLLRGGKGPGIEVAGLRDNGPKGTIEFNNCTIEHTEAAGIYVWEKSADRARLRFLNCRCSDVGLKTGGSGKVKQERPVPILLAPANLKSVKRGGGIDFVNCSVYDTVDRPALVLDDKGTSLGVHDLTGVLAVYNLNGARMETRCKTSKMQLDVEGHFSR